jgi:hypothetical protein
MSSTFALNIPTDIPWRRICVTKEMLDVLPCYAARPPRWQQSIAVFRYDPADDYQPFKDLTVSYLKVVVTIAPFVSEIGINKAEHFGHGVLVDDLEEAFPCYGALLQVSIRPPLGDEAKYQPEQYPYFSDFEPKKRELYEMVTDTGEVLSGSSTSLKVGKGAVSSDTVENYNIDAGWNFGMQASYAGTGGGHNIGVSGQHGQVTGSGLESQTLRNVDTSTERRELESHSTQLSQMYNLFQAFHLGTNRALFFIEPRPHIRQSEATFINGPRAIEGIQEVFLVTVRPKEMADFCVGAKLETAHLSKTPEYETVERTDLFNDFRLYARTDMTDPGSGQDERVSQPVSMTQTYYAPEGWEIVGYSTNTLDSSRVDAGPTVTYTASTLTVYGAVTSRYWEEGWDVAKAKYPGHAEDGILNVDVTVKLKKKDPLLKEYVRKLFLRAQNLCCCGDDTPPQLAAEPPIVYSIDLGPKSERYEIYSGLGSPATFAQSRQLASLIRTEMVRSLSSSRRVDMGAQTYTQSDVFLTRVADLLNARRSLRALGQPVAGSKAIPSHVEHKLVPLLGHESLGSVLASDATTLAARLRMPVGEVLALKQEALQSVAAQIKARAPRGLSKK